MTRAQETIGSFALGYIQWQCAHTRAMLYARPRGRPRRKVIEATHLSQMYIQTWFGEWRVS